MELVVNYDSEKYPKYDNYDAIEVSKTLDIPVDYDGIMGVPISFLNKYCPEQFEIVDKLDPIINGKHTYKRILISRKERSYDEYKACNN